MATKKENIAQEAVAPEQAAVAPEQDAAVPEEKNPAPENGPKENREPKTGPKMVKIRIPRMNPKQEDVFVSVNNYNCIVKRGVEVEVPDYVAEVLRHQEEMMETIALFEEKQK